MALHTPARPDMTLSMHAASVPVFKQMLASLAGRIRELDRAYFG